MKARLVPIVITLLLLEVVTGHSKPEKEKRYYQIKVKDKIGFINSSGKVIIEPQFAAAGNFYEDGLAPARKDGYYGYIDTTGKYVLPPIYDYAHDFVQGFAKVYKRSGSVFINTKGEELFHEIEEITFSPDTLLICRTKSGAYGVLDRNGNIIIDTIYGEIRGYYSGYFRVRKFPLSYKSADTTAIMDNKGNILINFRPVFGSEYIRDGFAIQEYVTSPNVYFTDIITINDEKIVTYNSWDFSRSHFGDSLIVLYADRKARFRFDSIDTVVSEHSSIILHLLNRTVVFIEPTSDPLYFVDGIAICSRKDSLVAINTRGEQVWSLEGKLGYESYYGSNTVVINITNADGESREGVINREGKFVIPPIYEKLEMTRNPDYYSYTEQLDNSTEPLETGFISVKSGKVAVIRYSGGYSKESFHFRSAITGGRKTYYNYDGKVIWQDSINLLEWKDLYYQGDFYNIDYLQNMNYIPRRKVIRMPKSDPVTRMPIRWETSFSIADSFPMLKSKGFSMVIDQLDTIRDWSKKLYCTLTIFNNTDTSWTMPENCNSVHLIMQAKDEEGQWRDIEVNRCTGCVISSGYFVLPSGHFAKFDIPIYTGSIKTKLRIKADFLKGNVYSNEFEGSINPGQFTQLDYVNSEEW